MRVNFSRYKNGFLISSASCTAHIRYGYPISSVVFELIEITSKRDRGCHGPFGNGCAFIQYIKHHVTF